MVVPMDLSSDSIFLSIVLNQRQLLVRGVGFLLKAKDDLAGGSMAPNDVLTGH